MTNLLPIAVVAVAWEVLTRLEVLNPRFFPSLGRIAEGFVVAFTEAGILSDALITVQRLGLAFVAAAIVGVVLGLATGLSRTVDALVQPFVDTLYPVPKVALLPIIILYVGVGETAFITAAFLTAFFQIVIHTAAAVRDIDPSLIEAGRNFGAHGVRYVSRVVLPGLLPAILSALRIGMGLCLITLIVVEFLAARTGLGAFVAIAWQTLTVDLLYVGLLLTGVLGHALNAVFKLVERVAMPWNVQWSPAGRGA